MHYGSDISVYGIGLQPNEIKEKLVDFFISEVKIELFHGINPQTALQRKNLIEILK